MTPTPEQPQPFRVLSIDGGGIKGVFAASFIAGLEKDLGEPLVDYFDLIAGTSTGGIIALGLGLGLSAQEILEFYEKNGPNIFPKRRGLRLRQLRRAKYSQEVLRDALIKAFGDRLLGESSTRLVIPSLNLETGRVHVFKTAHHERFERDYKERAVDVALATAAAPTYFPTHRLANGVALLDGGLWANNPMGVAAVEAVGLLEIPKGDVRLLSVSCTEQAMTTADKSSAGLGVAYWARKLLAMTMSAQSSSALGTAQLLLGHEHVIRVSPNVGGGRYKLDGADGIASLKALGDSESREGYPRIKAMFFEGKRAPFRPMKEIQR